MADLPTSTRRLVDALRQAGASPTLIARAEANEFHDYQSPHVFPIATLVSVAHAEGLAAVRDRAMAGDFDATKEESDEWAASPDGQATFAELLGKPRPGAAFFREDR